MNQDTVTLAVAVRIAGEKIFATRRSAALSYRCMSLSYALWFLLRGAGVASELVYGKYRYFPHVWVKAGDQIIDLTFTQFDNKAASVHIVPPPHKGYHATGPADEEAVRLTLEGNGLDDYTKSLIRRAVDLLPAITLPVIQQAVTRNPL